jgi:secreted trypsin-like serine protease
VADENDLGTIFDGQSCLAKHYTCLTAIHCISQASNIEANLNSAALWIQPENRFGHVLRPFPPLVQVIDQTNDEVPPVLWKIRGLQVARQEMRSSQTNRVTKLESSVAVEEIAKNCGIDADGGAPKVR